MIIQTVMVVLTIIFPQLLAEFHRLMNREALPPIQTFVLQHGENLKRKTGRVELPGK